MSLPQTVHSVLLVISVVAFCLMLCVAPIKTRSDKAWAVWIFLMISFLAFTHGHIY